MGDSMTFIWCSLLGLATISMIIIEHFRKGRDLGHLYDVNMCRDDPGRVALELECSEPDRALRVVFVHEGMELNLPENVHFISETGKFPTVYLHTQPGEYFFPTIMHELGNLIHENLNDWNKAEHFLAIHDLICYVYGRNELMKVTTNINFLVSDEVIRTLLRMGNKL